MCKSVRSFGRDLAEKYAQGQINKDEYLAEIDRIAQARNIDPDRLAAKLDKLLQAVKKIECAC